MVLFCPKNEGADVIIMHICALGKWICYIIRKNRRKLFSPVLVTKPSCVIMQIGTLINYTRIIMTDIILICVILFFAAFVQAASGFGYAIAAMAFLPMFLSLTDGMMVTVICSFLTSLYMFSKYRKHVEYRIVFLPLAISLVGAVIGLFLLTNTSNDLAIKILGGFLIALAIYFFFFAQKIKIPNNRISASVAGLLSGLTGGFFNIGGPPVVLFYSVAAKNKFEYLATLQFMFLCMSVVKFTYLTATLGLSREVLTIAPFGIAVSALGMVLGMILFKKMPEKIINRVVYVIMAISGIWYVIA